jgi:acyl-ACP thioesterase
MLKYPKGVILMLYEGKHRINYYDLDLMGRVKLSALLRMVHIAADVNANDLGIGFTRLHELNMSFVIQRFALAIPRMPAYGETVTLRTWPDSVARGAFWRKGDMHSANGEKLMEWTSMWILFNIAERKILRPNALPVEIHPAGDHGVTIMPEKITLPPPESKTHPRTTHTVRYADVDTNMHMNNSIYGDLIGNAMHYTADPAQNAPPWREVHINYLAETRLGEEIEMTTRREGNNFTVTGTVGAKTSFAARIRV